MSAAARLEPARYRLPDERESVTRRFRVGRLHGYLTVGVYPGGAPGELFVRLAKSPGMFGASDEESALYAMTAGLLDAVAIATSLLLQYGVPLRVVAAKYVGGRFAPAGFTGDPATPSASSILDYAFRWMLREFDPEAYLADGSVLGVEDDPALELEEYIAAIGMSAPAPGEVRVLAADVVAAAAEVVGVPREGVTGLGRTADLVRARRVVSYVLREDLGRSYPDIGRRTRRHHTTAMAACGEVAARLAAGDAQEADDVAAVRAAAARHAAARVAARVRAAEVLA